MSDPGTGRVFDALSGEEASAGDGGEPAVLFVGGCVRDALLGRAAGADIDLATVHPPEEARRLLEAAGVKVVPTGIDHGTVTAISGDLHFEVTTLRVDVETFGRHARVAYTADWAGDAHRRDFTMNALYADRSGAVFDPVGGLEDLRAHRVRFVGDPHARIREDVLRLLRFFRFHAHFGEGAPDPDGLAACAELASLAPSLSGERVAQETLKLLAAPDPARTLAVMRDHAILSHLLPQVSDLARLAALVTLEGVADRADPVRRLAATLAGRDAAVALGERLRLSNADRRRLESLADPARAVPTPDKTRDDQRRALHAIGAGGWRDAVLMAWAGEVAGAGAGDRRRTEAWRALLALDESDPVPAFPLKGADVLALGVAKGPEVGRLLSAVEAWWAEGGFAADREACLARLREVAGRDG